MLIVDDLVDTGKTARVVRDLMPKAHFATVYAKPMGRPLVDTFITEVSQDTWIFFPWDTGLAFRPPIRGRRLSCGIIGRLECARRYTVAPVRGRGETGRRKGLKIPRAERPVPVQIRPPAPCICCEMTIGCDGHSKWRTSCAHCLSC